MDINVIQNDHNQVTVFTNSGIQLVGTEASTLSFDAQGSMTATAQWSADPTKRTVGTIMLKGADGRRRRPDRQQGDPLGPDRGLSGDARSDPGRRRRASSTNSPPGCRARCPISTTDGTAVIGAPAGFDIDLDGLLAGNSVQLSYTDNTSGKRSTMSR